MALSNVAQQNYEVSFYSEDIYWRVERRCRRAAEDPLLKRFSVQMLWNSNYRIITGLKEGHLIRDCPEERRCDLCGVVGHEAKTCAKGEKSTPSSYAQAISGGPKTQQMEQAGANQPAKGAQVSKPGKWEVWFLQACLGRGLGGLHEWKRWRGGALLETHCLWGMEEEFSL
ncbi:hypothetical protein SKAU_G00235910 [Synaphobranchus kaupii]|uniref:CCHC-type domain-containing protein n=1 Tax=Synaphobranchus kaupii TaxID=118154 RepID=A0A9Q1F6P3_SYNKA|nr:hypothetical protein SKAU_G00235910 [Synaphobranchus kaupii]